MAEQAVRLFQTTIEHEGTWCGVEIPYAFLQALGWTERDVRVVVEQRARALTVRRREDAQEGGRG